MLGRVLVSPGGAADIGYGQKRLFSVPGRMLPLMSRAVTFDGPGPRDLLLSNQSAFYELLTTPQLPSGYGPSSRLPGADLPPYDSQLQRNP